MSNVEGMYPVCFIKRTEQSETSLRNSAVRFSMSLLSIDHVFSVIRSLLTIYFQVKKKCKRDPLVLRLSN